MNALFVANKPRGISSNVFLRKIKRKYGVKKAGFSGTLDPFASGCLIVAFGQYTKLFNYLDKTPKTYIATMWLGAYCESLDDENITSVKDTLPFHQSVFNIIKNSLLGDIVYTPPKYSAKKINGKRAYDLARNGTKFDIKQSTMHIYECEILSYSHPFLTFKIAVDEGSYIRSYAQLFAQKLGIQATLSALKRVSEGKFVYQNEKMLNPIHFLNLEKNVYNGDVLDISLGKKLNIENFLKKENSKYLIDFDDFFSIIEIKNQDVKYCLNKVEKC